ncbi:cysteine-rich protein 3 [Arapaima gigas]
MTSKCPKCEKPVFFAEKVSSLGKNWHRFCLKCERCNRTLSAGGHAEVRRLWRHPTPGCGSGASGFFGEVSETEGLAQALGLRPADLQDTVALPQF